MVSVLGPAFSDVELVSCTETVSVPDPKLAADAGAVALASCIWMTSVDIMLAVTRRVEEVVSLVLVLFMVLLNIGLRPKICSPAAGCARSRDQSHIQKHSISKFEMQVINVRKCAARDLRQL
jgi:hypothetical protein